MPGRSTIGGLLGIVLIAAASTSLLAACGGDDSDENEFAADADAICTEAARTQTELSLEYGPSPSAEDEVARIAGLRSSGEEAIEQLEQLSPPEGSGDDWDAYIENRRASNAALEQRSEAVEGEDPDAVAAAADDLGDLLAERDSIGEALGLGACARILPSDDDAAVREAVELASVSDDGDRVCAEAVSETLIEQEFSGDVDRCARAQSQARNSDSVEFNDVLGVAEVLATADVSLVGGALDGNDSTLTLVYEDGAYKVLNVTTERAGAVE